MKTTTANPNNIIKLFKSITIYNRIPKLTQTSFMVKLSQLETEFFCLCIKNELDFTFEKKYLAYNLITEVLIISHPILIEFIFNRMLSIDLIAKLLKKYYYSVEAFKNTFQTFITYSKLYHNSKFYKLRQNNKEYNDYLTSIEKFMYNYKHENNIIKYVENY